MSQEKSFAVGNSSPEIFIPALEKNPFAIDEIKHFNYSIGQGNKSFLCKVTFKNGNVVNLSKEEANKIMSLLKDQSRTKKISIQVNSNSLHSL